MKNIFYPNLNATGTDRRTFEKMLEECKRESKTKSTDYLRGYLDKYELSMWPIEKILIKISPNYEPLKVRVFRNELTERCRKEMEVYGNL